MNVASGVAGILWTTVGPGAAFAWAAAWMTLSLVLLAGPLRRAGTSRP